MSFKKRHLHKVLHSFPRPTAKPIQVTIRFNKMGYNRCFQMKVSQSSRLLSKLWTSHNRWGSKSSAADIVLTHKSLKQPCVLWAFLWREHLHSLLFFLAGFQLSWLLSHKIWKSEWHTKVNGTKPFLSTVSSLVWSITSPLKKKLNGFLKEQAKDLNDGKKICRRHPLIYFSSKIQD